jgi:hypothetical protein
MDIHAIIIEQLEWEGSLKSFTLQARPDYGSLWVAFPPEYDDVRNGPFHFLDEEYENLFQQRQAKCRTAKLPTDKYRQINNNGFLFNTTWNNIPTQKNQLTYYVLYLPEFAIPNEIKFLDTYSTGREFSKSVYRDDSKKRYAIYLECRSQVGIFNFNLFVNFYRDRTGFPASKFIDSKTLNFYEREVNEYWDYLLHDGEKQKVQQFFNSNVMTGDNYNVGNAGSVGPHSQAHNTTFIQGGEQLDKSVDLAQLADELSKLRQAMRSENSIEGNADKDVAISQIAQAEKAAKDKQPSKVVEYLNSAGKWALEIASKIGVSLAVEAIKQATNFPK